MHQSLFFGLKGKKPRVVTFLQLLFPNLSRRLCVLTRPVSQLAELIDSSLFPPFGHKKLAIRTERKAFNTFV